MKPSYAGSLLPQLVFLAGLACALPARAEALAAGVVARVNGVAISESRLQRALRETGLPDSPQLRESLKAQLISRELFRQAAAGANAYEDRPEVRQAMQDAHDATISQLYLRDAVKPAAVGEAQLKAQYDSVVASLGATEYKPRLIQLADAATAQMLLAQIRAGADFGALARRYSVAPSKAQGGSLDWISFPLPPQEGKTQGLPLPLAEAIAQLPQGAVAPAPVVWNGQHYLVKQDAVRTTRVPSYEEVKPALRRMQEAQALEKAVAALVVELIRNARIER
jgi:parvulin-like peptidyl-prolyl isomerase